MKGTRLWIIVCCLLWAPIGTDRLTQSQVIPSQRDPKKPARVLDRVPEATDEETRKVRAYEDWHNPYVMAYPDSFELILHDRPRTSERLSLAELETALLDLPLGRWPLGRVVAVQEIAMRSRGDSEKITKNVEALKRMLQTYKVKIALWPTA